MRVVFLLFVSFSGLASDPIRYQRIFTSGEAVTPTGEMTAFDNKIFFSAEHLFYGKELWYLADGSSQPQLAADLVPGELGSEPYRLTVFEDRLYFLVRSEGYYYHRVAYWDPQDEAVHLLDFEAENLFGPLDGKLYGIKNNSFFQIQGEVAQPVGRFVNAPPFNRGTPFHLNDRLYMVYRSWKEMILSRLEGEIFVTVTTLVDDPEIRSYHIGIDVIPTSTGSVFINLRRFQPDQPNAHLWVSNGTEEGTRILDSRPNLYGTAMLNGNLYYLAGDVESQTTLHRSDGTPEGTGPFLDQLLFLKGLTVVNSTLVLHAGTREDGALLALRDGDLKDLGPYYVDRNDPGNNAAMTLADDGAAYAGVITPEGASYLLRSDGTNEGTTLLTQAPFNDLDLAFSDGRILSASRPVPMLFDKGHVSRFDLNPGLEAENKARYGAQVVGDQLYTVSDHTVWRAGKDGPEKVLDLVPGEVARMTHRFNQWLVIQQNERVLLLDESTGETKSIPLANSDQVTSDEHFLYLTTEMAGLTNIYRIDAATYEMVLLDMTGLYQGDKPLIHAYNGRLIYPKRGTEWLDIISAGGPDDLIRLGEIKRGHFQKINERVTTYLEKDGLLYLRTAFHYYDEYVPDYNVTGRSVYRTDGTAEGTAPASRDLDPIYPLAAGDARWRQTDAKAAELVLAGAPDDAPPLFAHMLVIDGWDQARPINGILPVVVNEKYFRDHGLWLTDGTEAGTRLVKVFDEYAAPPPRPLFLGQTATRIFFANHEQWTGNHTLWACNLTDGTVTKLIDGLNLNVGHESIKSIWQDIVTFEDNLYFSAKNDLGGEVWMSDGTQAGTHSLDLFPGVNSAFPDQMMVLQGDLWFRAWAGDGSWYWWRQRPGEVQMETEPLDVRIVAPWMTVGGCPVKAEAGGDIINAAISWRIDNGEIVGTKKGPTIRYRATGQQPVVLHLTVNRGIQTGTAQAGTYVLTLPQNPCP